MSIREFNSSFFSNEEKSVLFEALRKLGRIENWQALESEISRWIQWDLSPDPDGGGLAPGSA